jgi:hypothetical protein
MRRTRSVWPTSSRTCATTVAIACIAVTASMTGTAQAGRYHVYSCRTPSGQVAPTDGWSGSVTGAYDYDLNTCAEGGALVAGLGANVARTANTNYSTWAFGTPPGETLAAGTLWRAGDTAGGSAQDAAYLFSLAGPEHTYDSANVFDNCVSFEGCSGQGDVQTPMSMSNELAVPAENLGGHLYVDAACGGVSGYNCPDTGGDGKYSAVVYLFAADLVLEDSTPPVVSNVGGGLADSNPVSGTTDVEFDASDPGPGIYKVSFSADGQVVQSSVLNSNYGRCEDVGQTTDGLPAFLYTQPCPASESVDVPFDTVNLSNGTHQMVVGVSDAAGNSAVVLDRKVTVENDRSPASSGTPESNSGSAVSNTVSAGLAANAQQSSAGSPNGVNASESVVLTVRWARTRKAHLVSSYGRAQTITGRLTNAEGMPIAGAVLGLTATPAYDGAASTVMTSPRTGLRGGFVVHLPGRISSRTLRFAYRSRLGAPLPVATRTLMLSVPASIVLRIAPRIASVGRIITFIGVLHGSPIPLGGKQLVLEARSPGSPWIQFHVIRAGTAGRFHSSYRFRLAGPVDYRFRLVSTYEPDFPFSAGVSNVVKVYER